MKKKLGSMKETSSTRVFRVNRKLLRVTASKPGGKTSEKIIREDRDGRGF